MYVSGAVVLCIHTTTASDMQSTTVTCSHFLEQIGSRMTLITCMLYVYNCNKPSHYKLIYLFILSMNMNNHIYPLLKDHIYGLNVIIGNAVSPPVHYTARALTFPRNQRADSCHSGLYSYSPILLTMAPQRHTPKRYSPLPPCMTQGNNM